MIMWMQLLLGGIGMIALVVAVIGISNTMTTSVFDRINEIWILKVLGSVFLGVAAGYFPARWASKLRPIEAVARR